MAVVINVGPSATEVARLADTVASLLHFEPQLEQLVLVDDAPPGAGRDLTGALGPAAATAPVTVVANPRAGRGDGWAGGLCAGTLAALARVHAGAGTGARVAFVVKLDCDSLVIAPFRDAVAGVLEGDASLGMVGAHAVTYGGGIRDWERWARIVARRARALRPSRRAPFVHQALVGPAGRVRADIRAALVNGYEPGEHCLGGGYAIARRLLDALHAAGTLADPLRWLHSGCGEDVMLGVLTRACGLRARSLCARGEPFAIGYKQLPDTPANLLANGHAIVHSVAGSGALDERAIRAFFRERRR